jgi:hypothetical protein
VPNGSIRYFHEQQQLVAARVPLPVLGLYLGKDGDIRPGVVQFLVGIGDLDWRLHQDLLDGEDPCEPAYNKLNRGGVKGVLSHLIDQVSVDQL